MNGSARQRLCLLAALPICLLSACAGQQAPSEPINSVITVSPEEGCRAFSNPVRKARCVASCRVAGVSCAQRPPLLGELLPRLEREAASMALEARAAQERGDFPEVLRLSGKARAIMAQTGQHWQSARLGGLEARALFELGRLGRALDVAGECLPIVRGTGDARDAVRLHLVSGLARLGQGDVSLAFEEFKKADALRIALSDSPDLAATDLLYARLALGLGRFDRATQALSRAQEAGDIGGSSRLQAGAHQGKGAVLHFRGELAGALGEYGKALSIESRAGHRIEVVRHLLSVSRLFLDLGRFDAAFHIASVGAKLAHEADLVVEEARAEVLLGRISEDLGSQREAAENYSRALARGHEALHVGSSDRFWAEAGAWRLCSAGGCEGWNASLPALPARLSAASAGPAPPLTPDTLLATALIAREYLTRGARGEAEGLLNNIENLLAVPLPPAVAWRIHHVVGLTWRELGAPLQSRTHLTRSLELLEVLRSGVDVHLLRQHISGSRRAVYEDLVDARLARSGGAVPERDVRLALVTAERMKARGLVELLDEAPGDGDAARQLRHGWVAQRLLGQLQKVATEPDLWGAVPLVAQLCESWSGMRWGADAAVGPAVPFAFESLPQHLMSMLPEKTALLSYATGRGRSYLFVVKREGVTLHVLPGVEKIDPAVKRYVRSMLRVRFSTDAQFAEHLSAGRDLSKMVLDPALSALKGIDRVIVAADGPLRSLPFSTLIVEDDLRQGAPVYMVRRAALTHVPSAAAWAVLKGRNPERWAPTRAGFVAIGDPHHTASDELEVRVEFHDGSVAFVTDGQALGDFAELRHSRRELRAISRMLGPARSEVLLGQEATEAGLGALDLSQTRYLHFATHGLTDASPLLPAEILAQLDEEAIEGLVNREPALVLSRAEGDAEDGLLRLEEILDMPLSTDLVVLSGCSTGRGGVRMGDAAHGLAGAFLVAGSRRAVASLWSVADKPTSALMIAFYRGMRRGLEPDEALRQAQLRQLFGGSVGSGVVRGVAEITGDAPEQRPKARAKATRNLLTPFFWAPFVVIGD